MDALKFVPYNDKRHRDQFFQLNLEYLTWADNAVYEEYGERLITEGTVREYLEKAYNEFSSIKPPKGIIYILEADEKAVGMGALKKLDDKVGEIKRMYIRPGFRGGLGTQMYYLLEDKAKEFGFNMLRLDTTLLNVAALGLYRKVGFKEIEGYSSREFGVGHKLDSVTVIMEKKL
jgi:ribosomal protein S18 acetylase RimI-like enzyme